MKNLVKYIVILVLLILNSSSIASAQGYCPTPDETMAPLHELANTAKKCALNHCSQAEKQRLNQLKLTIQKQKNETFSNCLQYFKTTQKPDCERMKILYMGYDDLDESLKPAAKKQITSMYPQFAKVCPLDTKVLKNFMNNML